MKELVITPPEGFEVDKEHSTFEKIVFKPIDSKPRSWEEYWKQQYRKNETGYFIDLNSDIRKCTWGLCDYNSLYTWRNIVPSKELAEAFLAMMQLMSLRQAWIGDWKPDWGNFDEDKWCIVNHNNKITTLIFGKSSRPLSFPTQKKAFDFMNWFKDLLEVAKSLL